MTAIGRDTWAGLVEDARGYLVAMGELDEEEPVPRDELLAQLKTNGYGEGRDEPPASTILGDALGDGGPLVEEDGAVRLAEEDDENAETPEPAGIEPRGPGSGDDNPEGEDGETGEDLDKYRRVYLDAAERAGREPWEPVEEEALREALAAIGFEELLDNGTLFDVHPWRFVDVSDEGEDARRRWYYPSGDEPRPDEFRRFDALLREAAPDDYEPHYFRVARAGKDPATQYGSWKTDDARVTIEEAVEWMKEGGNVGVAGRGGCRECGGDGRVDGHACSECDGTGENAAYDGPLVNVDIDDDEETTPDDVPTSLRARSRSRTGWHTWFFDEEGDIPNIPTDQYGEVRTNWQYVVAPGSFVASCREEIPDDADDPGYYTVEDEEPVASIEYDDLPEVFRDFAAEVEAAEEEIDDRTEAETDDRTYDTDGDTSAVFDVEAADLVSATHDDTDRFSSIFHGSGTGANMSVSGDKVHCWRHGVAHGGLQALATLSDVDQVSTYGCGDLGAEHKNSNAGSNRLKGDWRLVWGAWHEAKSRSEIPEDDPVPYRVLRELAVDDDLVEREDLVERDADTGEVADGDADGTYLALPSGTYNDVLQHIREEYDVDPGREEATGRDTDGEAYDDDPRGEDARDLLGLDVVVEPGHAMRAARAVTPDDLDKPLPELEREDVDDVAIAVALADDVIDSPDVFPRDDGYTEAYYRARDVFGAPLPKYLDNSTLTERFDLVKAALDRVGPEHILDTLRSTITVEDPPSQAIAKIDPSWEESESGERIVAGYGSGFWCTEHDVSFTPLQIVALEHGIIDAEDDYPTGEGYKRAYRLLREEYGAPIPRWRANVFEEVGVLPPAVRVVDDDLSARDTFSLDEARNRTEELVRDAVTTTDRAQLVTVIPGGGKTFSTAIVADDEPVLYTPPRNELKKQMEEYAREIRESDEFDAEPSAYHLPILAENRIPEVGINAGVAAVRGDEAALQDREALRETVADQLEAGDEADAEADEDDAVDLDRTTCPAAEGDHGKAWRTAVQVAHALGFNPATIHRNARTLFGEALPCCDGGACEYTEGWDVVREPGSCPDILIGSAGHAHVDSATSYYREDDGGETVTDPRAVVVDEFPSDTYATEYGERYMDHAVWLAEALAGVENREELLDADLNTDTWVSLWLRGEADEYVAAAEAIDALRAGADLLGAVEAAEDLLDRDPIALASGATSANLRGVVDVLERLTDGGLGVDDTDAIADVLGSAAEVISNDADRAYADGREEAGRLYGLADTLREDILQPLNAAAAELGEDSLADAIADRTADLPIAGDLRQLVDDAVAAAEGDAPRELVEAAADALQGGRDGCRALAVGAEGGYAHPDAWALLAGAIAEPDDDGVSVGTQRTLSLGDGGEGLQHKTLSVNGADIHVDRDHHGAVVFDRPSFTDRDGGTCPLVGLDATARRDLWRIALGRDAEVRDIHDSAAERRRHIREGMNHTVVQTANTPLPYHGDPSGRNFQEDLAVVRAAAEEYTGPGGLDDKAPAVISTQKVLNYLDEELDELAEEKVNYENMKGSDALGSHQVLAILGSQHYGDTEPERWAMYAGESADRGETSGDTLDYGSDVANTYLKHMREDHTMQAILRAGRNDDRSVVVAHTSALRDDLPVVAEGATVSAHSKGALAVAEAAADLNDRSFTAADVAERIRDDDRSVGLRQVQNILADLRSSGYLQVESEGSRGREYEYGVDEDPGLADVELPEPSAVAEGDGKTKSEVLDKYSWNFVLYGEADVGEGMLPPPTPTIPAADTAEALVDGDPPS